MKINENNFLYSLTSIRQRLFKFMEKGLSQRNIDGIAPSYGDVLFALDQGDTKTVLDVARYTNKDKSTISSVINRLEANGYVVKEKDSSDARFTNLKLTAKARKFKPAMLEISAEMNSRMFMGLTDDEKATLFSLLERISDNI